MTLPFDHTHDLDLGVSRSESEIDISQEWDSLFTWNKKYMSHPFMTMILISVTMVGWVDVPGSDWGDFRLWRAVAIFSSQCSCHCIMKFSEIITIDRNDVHACKRSRSKVKVTEVIRNFAPIWTFPDHNYSLNLQMAMKLCTKLEVA